MIKLEGQKRLIIFACVGILLLHVWSLMRYPAPHIDEAWLVSRAWGFIQSGHPFGVLDAGLTENMDHYWITNQWLITALHALVLRFFTTPMLLPLRVFSLVIGSGLLAVNFVIARRLLRDWRLAAGSTMLLATSLAFFHSAHQVRYDILAAMLGYAALALVLWDQKGRFGFGMIAGMVTGLAVETHLNSLIFIPAVGIYYLIQYGWQVWRKGTIWGYALGCTAGLFYYLALHYFPSPATYQALMTLSFGQFYQPPILSGSLHGIFEGLLDASRLLFVSAGPMALLGLLAAPKLIARRTKEAVLILALNISMIITAGLIIPYKTGHYGIYLAPGFLLLVTFFLAEFIKRPWAGRWWNYAERVVVWGCVAGTLALSLVNLSADRYSIYLRDQAKVNRVIQTGDVIMGPQHFWFGLYDHRYLSWNLIYLYLHLYPEATIADSFAHFDPDVLVIDSEMQKLISDTLDPSDRWYAYHISEKELAAYLAQHAVLVLDEKDESNQPLHVYRLRK